MARVFVDTNVLFPFSIMDLVLALTEDAVGRAQAIITWNQADFPAAPLAAMGVRVCDPDEYLCELLSELPHEVVATVVRLAAEKRRPPKIPGDLANDLAKAGVPSFAERLREAIDQPR